MKKFLTSVAFALTFTMLFSACSCAGCNTETEITGSAYWHSGKTYSPNFSEHAIYNVNYVDDYKITTGGVKYDYSKSGSPENLTATYDVGTYEVIVKSISINDLPEETRSLTSANEFYKLTTELVLPVTYKFSNDSAYTFTDKISSEIYFESISTSLRPLYSAKTYDSTYFSSTDTILHSAYTTEIKWADKAELTITDNSAEKIKTDEYAEKDGEYGYAKISDQKYSVKYSKRCVLDNEQLLFALRAFTLSTDFSETVKIFDTAYKNQLTSISIKSSETATVTDAWTLYLNDKEETKSSTSTFLTTIVRNDSDLSGSPLICYYQITKYDGDDENVVADASGRSWLIKMVSRLPYGSGSYGALDYTLKSITVTD